MTKGGGVAKEGDKSTQNKEKERRKKGIRRRKKEKGATKQGTDKDKQTKNGDNAAKEVNKPTKKLGGAMTYREQQMNDEEGEEVKSEELGGAIVRPVTRCG